MNGLQSTLSVRFTCFALDLQRIDYSTNTLPTKIIYKKLLVNSLNILYGSLSEHCTSSSCPTMNAGAFEFLWMDKNDPKYKKPVKVSAPECTCATTIFCLTLFSDVTLLMASIEKQVNDETIFPSDPKVPFPSNFMKIVKKIFTRLFRVYAHIYLRMFSFSFLFFFPYFVLNQITLTMSKNLEKMHT